MSLYKGKTTTNYLSYELFRVMWDNLNSNRQKTGAYPYPLLNELIDAVIAKCNEL